MCLLVRIQHIYWVGASVQQNSRTFMYGGKDRNSCNRLKTHGLTTTLSKNHQMTKWEDLQKQDKNTQRKQEQEDPEVYRETYYAFVTTTESVSLRLDSIRYSCWLKMKRILSWVNRFIHNCQRSQSDRTFGKLPVSDLKRAEIQLRRHAQCIEEWAAFSRGRPVPSSSKLIE